MNAFQKAIAKTATTTDTKKKKSDHPVIVLEGEAANAAVAFNEEKKAMKEHETAMRSYEQPIQEACVRRMDEDALKGKFSNTYKVEAKVGDKVVSNTFVSSDRFTVPQDEESLGKVKEVLGDHFDECITQKTTITLKEEIFADESMQKELMDLIGDKFAKFFDVSTKYATTDGFNEKVYQIASTKDELAMLRSYVTQYKPAIK